LLRIVDDRIHAVGPWDNKMFQVDDSLGEAFKVGSSSFRIIRGKAERNPRSPMAIFSP